MKHFTAVSRRRRYVLLTFTAVVVGLVGHSLAPTASPTEVRSKTRTATPASVGIGEADSISRPPPPKGEIYPDQVKELVAAHNIGISDADIAAFYVISPDTVAKILATAGVTDGSTATARQPQADPSTSRPSQVDRAPRG